jgi:hypothetical protein
MRTIVFALRNTQQSVRHAQRIQGKTISASGGKATPSIGMVVHKIFTLDYEFKGFT